MPVHFDLKKVESDPWLVNKERLLDAALAWRDKHDIEPSAKDKVKICLMPIDVQNTFCLPKFELFVGGASGRAGIDDTARLCEFIYSFLGTISKIFPTMDTHIAFQIFFRTFWVDEKGNHPAPMTTIKADDVAKGVWRVYEGVADIADGNYAALQRHAEHYVRQLELAGKYLLTIWPFHATLGGIEHALMASLQEACLFHCFARNSQTGYEIKGGNPLTENYSVLRPEVLTGASGAPIAQKNSNFFKRLVSYDMVIIAGQAKSHCVAWTIQDLLNEIASQDPELAKKVYLLEDCTSPIVIPGVIDFTDLADEAFKKFSDAGMHIVKSTQPMAKWPDSPLA